MRRGVFRIRNNHFHPRVYERECIARVGSGRMILGSSLQSRAQRYSECGLGKGNSVQVMLANTRNEYPSILVLEAETEYKHEPASNCRMKHPFIRLIGTYFRYIYFFFFY